MLELLLAFPGIRPSPGQKVGVLGVVRLDDDYYMEWRDENSIDIDEAASYKACIELTVEGREKSVGDNNNFKRPFVITSMHNAIAFTYMTSVIGDDMSSTILITLKDGPPKLFHTPSSSSPSEVVQVIGMIVEGCDLEPIKNGVAFFKTNSIQSPRHPCSSLGGLSEDWRGRVLEQFSRVTTFYSETAQRILGIRQSRHNQSSFGEYVENPWIERRSVCLPPPRFLANRQVDASVMSKFVDKSGQIVNHANFCLLVHCSAIKDFSTRWNVWLHLLKLKSPDMSDVQFEEHCRVLKDEYDQKLMDGLQLCEETVSRIKKDVVRTDRLVFYPQDDGHEMKQPSLQLMERILMTYVATDPELDYVQGMNDFLSPIIYVAMNSIGLDAANEYLIFWMFQRLMSLVRENFKHCSESIEGQLEMLREMVWEVDPLYYDYFSLHHDSLQLYFSYRWLLLWFKREISYEHVFPVWDTILSADKPKQYVLCIALAMLIKEKGFLVNNSRRFDEILSHFNEMAGTWNINSILSLASQLEVWSEGKAAQPLTSSTTQ